MALRYQGRFPDALTSLRRADELGARRGPAWPYPSAKEVKECERLLALDLKLAAVLDGKAEPAGAAEQLELADLCTRFKKQNRAAVRFYAAAFAADPALAANLARRSRYNAACAAAQAAAGEGTDAADLADAVRAELRGQALNWLRADLNALTKQIEANGPPARLAGERLAHWRADTNLASVRGDALAGLPVAERQAWQALWADVAALQARSPRVPAVAPPPREKASK